MDKTVLKVRRVEIEEFLKAAGPALEQSEAENNLILGIAANLASGSLVPEEPPWLLVIERDGVPLSGAVMTPPNKLILPRLDAGSIQKLLDFLIENRAPLAGVNGPKGTAAAITAGWRQRTRGQSRVTMEMRIYKAESVEAGIRGVGQIRLARADDLPFMIIWARGFETEVMSGEMPEEMAGAKARQWLEREVAYIWEEDSKPCCGMLAVRRTATGVCLAGVFTPPELRRRGYGTAAVAEITRRLLSGGRKFVCLYTDLSNPTSNSIYQKIGYRPVCDCDAHEYSL